MGIQNLSILCPAITKFLTRQHVRSVTLPFHGIIIQWAGYYSMCGNVSLSLSIHTAYSGNLPSKGVSWVNKDSLLSIPFFYNQIEEFERSNM